MKISKSLLNERAPFFLQKLTIRAFTDTIKGVKSSIYLENYAEKNISAEKKKKSQAARVPEKNEHRRRAKSRHAPATKRSQEIDGLSFFDMLPAKYRLKGRKAFNDLFRAGETFSNDVLMMKVAPGEKDEPAKFGFGASLKFSKKAAERNQVKRWMREAVRSKLEKIRSGHNIVFFVSPKFPKEKLNLQLISEKVENLLKEAKII